MELEEIIVNTRNWIDQSQNRDYLSSLVSTALNLQIAYALELVKVNLMRLRFLSLFTVCRTNKYKHETQKINYYYYYYFYYFEN